MITMADLLALAHPNGTLIAILIASSWGIGEYCKYRRLRKFGDRRILGLEWRWIPKVTGIVLIAFGTASLATIVFPSRPLQSDDSSRSQEARVYLDLGSLAPSGLARLHQWDLIEALLAAIPAENEAHLFSLYRLENPPEMVIPPTSDLAGYRILLKRLRIEWSASSAERAIAAPVLFQKAARDGGECKVLLLTGRDLESIKHRLSTQPAIAKRMAIAQLQPEDAVFRFWHRSLDGPWILGEGIGVLAALITSAPPENEGGTTQFSRINAIRSLALIALIFLSLEYFLAGIWPVVVQRETSG